VRELRPHLVALAVAVHRYHHYHDEESDDSGHTLYTEEPSMHTCECDGENHHTEYRDGNAREVLEDEGERPSYYTR